MILLALLNILSDGADVACIERYFLAKKARRGNVMLYFFHQIIIKKYEKGENNNKGGNNLGIFLIRGSPTTVLNYGVDDE